MRFWSLPVLKDIFHKDVPRQEPRRPFGRAIVNKASLLYVSILSLSVNRLPRNRLDGDTRIGHAGSTQKQTFGSSKFHPNLASSASHVDDAQRSLMALQESADALPDPHLKSVVSGVSALLQIAKRLEQSKKEAQAWSEHSLKVLETLTEAVGHDPLNIPPLILGDIFSFEELLLEILTAMEPLMEQDQTSRPFRSNRRGTGFNDFDKRLSELQQKFEKACSQRSGFGRLPFRCRSPFSELKSRLSPVSSTCADVGRTTLRVLEKLSLPILSGAINGISAVWDTTERVKQSKQKAQALSQLSATLAEAIDRDQSNMPPLMLKGIHNYRDQLSEIRAAMVPITGRGRISRLFRLNRNEGILDTFNHRLNEARQRFMDGNVTQIRIEVSQFQKHTADSLSTLNHRLFLSNLLF